MSNEIEIATVGLTLDEAVEVVRGNDAPEPERRRVVVYLDVFGTPEQANAIKDAIGEAIDDEFLGDIVTSTIENEKIKWVNWRVAGERWEPNNPNVVEPLPTGDAGCEWQPIESAPKDGTRILLWWSYWAHDPIIGSWAYGKWVSEHALSGEGPSPTHWQPLPAPPEGKESK